MNIRRGGRLVREGVMGKRGAGRTRRGRVQRARRRALASAPLVRCPAARTARPSMAEPRSDQRFGRSRPTAHPRCRLRGVGSPSRVSGPRAVWGETRTQDGCGRRDRRDAPATVAPTRLPPHRVGRSACQGDLRIPRAGGSRCAAGMRAPTEPHKSIALWDASVGRSHWPSLSH